MQKTLKFNYYNLPISVCTFAHCSRMPYTFIDVTNTLSGLYEKHSVLSIKMLKILTQLYRNALHVNFSFFSSSVKTRLSLHLDMKFEAFDRVQFKLALFEKYFKCTRHPLVFSHISYASDDKILNEKYYI